MKGKNLIKNPIKFYKDFFEEFRKLDKSKGEIKAINEKSVSTINTPIYATIVYFKTSSFNVARRIHNLIILECQYILFLDNYHETGLIREKRKAQKSHEVLLSKLNKKQKERLMKLENKLFSYWDLERKLSGKLKKNKKVSDSEIKTITRKKSTDVFLYFLILNFFLKVPKSIINEIYKQQLIRDFDDDMRDLFEDFRQAMPNPLLLRLYRRKMLDPNEQYSQDELEQLVKAQGIDKEQRKFIEEYIKNWPANLPNQYGWIQNCGLLNCSGVLD